MANQDINRAEVHLQSASGDHSFNMSLVETLKGIGFALLSIAKSMDVSEFPPGLTLESNVAKLDLMEEDTMEIF